MLRCEAVDANPRASTTTWSDHDAAFLVETEANQLVLAANGPAHDARAPRTGTDRADANPLAHRTAGGADVVTVVVTTRDSTFGHAIRLNRRTTQTDSPRQSCGTSVGRDLVFRWGGVGDAGRGCNSRLGLR